MPRRPHGILTPLEQVSSEQVRVMSWPAHIHQLPNDSRRRVVIDMTLDFPSHPWVHVSILVGADDVDKATQHVERAVTVQLHRDGIYATHIDLDGTTPIPIQSID